MTEFARAGSQRWLQVAVERYPDLLAAALQQSGVISHGAEVTWRSALREDDFREYRDAEALRKAGISALPRRPLKDFWPARGPVWDAVGVGSDGRALFVESKAHIPEAASPACRASSASLSRIQASLAEARRAYSPKSSADWSGLFYQYANRLAYQVLINRLNGIPSALVFIYFVNDVDMQGPTSEAEWKGAIRLIHAALGLPASLTDHGVHEAFLEVRRLKNAA
jgi:hypothetical protein